MKNNLLLLFFLLLGSWTNALAVPPLVNYAGRVAVKGQPFEGTGQLKFALVNASGKQTYWSNDGTSVNGSEPTAHVSVQVNGGLYSILLGNTAITGMSALDVSVFRTHSDVKLRVWFNDGKNGFQQLSPDRPFSSVPYALSAGIPNGSIELSMLSPALRASLGLGSGQTSGSGPEAIIPDIGSFIAAIGNSFYFAHGNELWVHNTNNSSSTKLQTFYAGQGTVLGNHLYFVADDGIHMPELWKSDGTVNGTNLVKDIYPSAHSSSPDSLTAVGNLLFFTADDGTHGRELWKSDGTVDGTSLVKDIAPGANSSSPSGLTAVGNLLFFTADDGTHGRKSWKSDGTSGGTLLAENTPSPTPIGTQVGDKFLVATPYGSNSGIFVRDPVSGSLTQLIAPLGGATTNYFFGKNLVYAQSAEGKTWKSDGTLSGTSLVNISFPWSARVVGDSLYWTELDGYDYKLMKLDGSTTSMVKNSVAGNGIPMYVQGDYLLWDDAVRLWKSDGTEAGTVIIKSGAGTSSIFHSTGNTIYLKTGSSIETIDLTAQ